MFIIDYIVEYKLASLSDCSLLILPEKVNRETGEEEYGSEDEYDSESDSDEEIQEAGEPQYLTSKDQQLLYLSNQNCYYHIVELRRMRDAEMTVSFRLSFCISVEGKLLQIHCMLLTSLLCCHCIKPCRAAATTSRKFC